MGFIPANANKTLRNGPSLILQSSFATSAEKVTEDKKPYEDEYAFLGKTPVSKKTLHKNIADSLGNVPDINQLNITKLTGAPANAVYYGHVTGEAEYDGKTYEFTYYYNADGTVDKALTKFEEKPDPSAQKTTKTTRSKKTVKTS